MTPWQLAKSGSEHGEQTALFCYCAKAKHYGFELALQKASYESGNIDILKATGTPVPELSFFHSIPNGGNRGDTDKSRSIEGGKLKAEGLLAGVLDCFWPLRRGGCAGLYIEMKRPKLKHKTNLLAGCSDEQLKFGEYVSDQGYAARVCYTWLEAAEVLKWYYNLGK